MRTRNPLLFGHLGQRSFPFQASFSGRAFRSQKCNETPIFGVSRKICEYEPRPHSRARACCMMSSFCLCFPLLFCVVVGQKWNSHARYTVSYASQTLCPSHPYPTANVSDVLQVLCPYLDEVGKNISSLLSTTPGGAVVSVVYRDTVIWTHGDGAINMSGERLSLSSREQRFMASSPT